MVEHDRVSVNSYRNGAISIVALGVAYVGQPLTIPSPSRIVTNW